MKILFLGNHTVGVRALRVLHRVAELVGVVAHPDDPEDAVCYESVFAAAGQLGVPAIRATGKSATLAGFIRRQAPDLLWITDYRYLLPAEVIALAPHGAINLHPSLLPRYRGRAPINWAILHGETRLGLTAHLVDEGMDTGDIVGQRTYDLRADQDVGDALNLLYPLYEELTAEVVAALVAGHLVRRPQTHAEATAFPRRTPAEGVIDWAKPAHEIRNLIRAVARPYPGAFSPVGTGCLRLWRAGEIRSFSRGCFPLPGRVLEVGQGTFWVACGDAALLITDHAWDGPVNLSLQPGAILGAIPPQPALLSA